MDARAARRHEMRVVRSFVQRQSLIVPAASIERRLYPDFRRDSMRPPERLSPDVLWEIKRHAWLENFDVGTTCMCRDLLSDCLLYTSPSPRDGLLSRMPS